MKITVYTKPGCVQCKATFRALDKAQIDYETVDITTDSQARDYVMSLGYLQAPVLVAGTEHWSGFRPERIKELTTTQSTVAPQEPAHDGYRVVAGVPIPEYHPPDLEAVKMWMRPALTAAAEAGGATPPLGSSEWAELRDNDPRKLAAALEAGLSEVSAEARIPAEMRRDIEIDRDHYQRAIAEANETVHEYVSEHQLSNRPNHQQLQRIRYRTSADAVTAQQYLDRSDFPSRAGNTTDRYESGSVDPPGRCIGPLIPQNRAMEGRTHA